MAKVKRSEARRRLEAIVGPLTVGMHLRAIRHGDELTQQVFAEKLGISKQHLSDVENGRKGVSAERAAAWARALGYSERLFVQLALQEELDRAGIGYAVCLDEAP